MKKSLLLLAIVSLFAANVFAASYWVVMKDGSRYECKQKWTTHDGKAWFTSVSGQTFAVDPVQIDTAKSDEVTKYNGAQVINIGGPTVAATTAAPQQGIGAQIKLRKAAPAVVQAPPPTTSPSAPLPMGQTNAEMGAEVIQKFERAYENVGIFEHKVVSTGAHTIRAELTADNEEKVFNAISATAFLTVRDAGVPGVHIDMIELFMRTTTGGSSGRFQMTREDALAVVNKQISKGDYFVRKVLY
jgi:hypothetical protein